MKSLWSRQSFGFHKRVPLLWAMPPMRHIECKSQRSHPAPKTIQKSLFIDHDHDHVHWCLFFVAFLWSNHPIIQSMTICDYRSVQSRAGKQFSMPPRSAWALLRGPWRTWHFESLNHLTGIQTSQTLCLKDLAPELKKNNVSNFAPLSQLNYQFWREIWLNWGGRSISATSTETNVCSGLSAKMPPRSRMARQICEEKIVYDIFG